LEQFAWTGSGVDVGPGLVSFRSVWLWQNDQGVVTTTKNAPFWHDFANGADTALEQLAVQLPK